MFALTLLSFLKMGCLPAYSHHCYSDTRYYHHSFKNSFFLAAQSHFPCLSLFQCRCISAGINDDLLQSCGDTQRV
jgi:hypothetical protein